MPDFFEPRCLGYGWILANSRTRRATLDGKGRRAMSSFSSAYNHQMIVYTYTCQQTKFYQHIHKNKLYVSTTSDKIGELETTSSVRATTEIQVKWKINEQTKGSVKGKRKLTSFLLHFCAELDLKRLRHLSCRDITFRKHGIGRKVRNWISEA